MISVLICAKDEEMNIKDCIKSVSLSDDIIVIDDGSEDSTTLIAEEMGARVIKVGGISKNKAFGGDEARFRNWALHSTKFRNKWVLMIDADERISKECWDVIYSNVKADDNYVAYQLGRIDHLNGNALRYCQSVNWYTRVVRPESVYYVRRINPYIIIKGRHKRLKTNIYHYPFSKGISSWVEKHNKYSTLEAEEIFQNRLLKTSVLIKAVIFDRNSQTWRRSLKLLFYRMPCRPVVKFLFLYLMRLGFLDGKPGLDFSLLMMYYEKLINLKLAEIKE